MGWYITFLYTFTGLLLLIAIPGLALYIYQEWITDRWAYLEPNSAVPIYGICVAIWATIFLEKWKQRQNEMKIMWDLYHFKRDNLISNEYHGDHVVDDNTEMITKVDYYPMWKKRLFTDFPLILTALIFIGVNTSINEKLMENVNNGINTEDNHYWNLFKKYISQFSNLTI